MQAFFDRKLNYLFSSETILISRVYNHILFYNFTTFKIIVVSRYKFKIKNEYLPKKNVQVFCTTARYMSFNV